MGRKKLKLELIEEKARNTTIFKKRKVCLVRKLHEFSILCDVKTCMIIYGPNRDTEPEIFPSNNPEEVRRIIDLYKSKINNTTNTNTNSSVKTFGVADYFHDRKKQNEKELAKLRRKNLEAKYPTRPEVLDGLTVPQLRQLHAQLADKTHGVKTLVNLLKGNLNPLAVSPITAMPQSHHSASAAATNQQQQLARVEMVNDRRCMQQLLQALINNHPMMVRQFEGGSTSANIQLNHQVFLDPAGSFYAASLPPQFLLQPFPRPPLPPQDQFPSSLVPAVVQPQQLQYFYTHDEEFFQYNMSNQMAARNQNQEREQDDHEEFGVNNFLSY